MFVHEIVNVYLSPSPTPALSCSRPVQRGALLEAFGSGTERKLAGGATRRLMRRLGTCLASTNREALGFRPARNWVCHCELAGRGQASGAKKPCSRISSGICQVPGRTDQGLKTSRRDAERRCRVPLFPGNPGNKPRPLPRCAFRRSVSPQKGEIN